MKVVACLLVLVAVIALCECCCVPRQWEAIEGISTGYDEKGQANLEQGTIALSYDAYGRRIAATYNLYNSGTRKVVSARLIMDFAKRRQYIVSREKCVVSYIREPFKESCIPGKSQASYTLGTGRDAIVVNSYSMKIDQVQAYISVTNDCVPVGESLFGEIKGVGFMETIGYLNVTLGIKNPDVFVAPAICRGGETRKLVFGKLREPIMDLRKHAILGV